MCNGARLPHDFQQHAVQLDEKFTAVDFCHRGVGHVQRALVHGPGLLPADQLDHFQAAFDLGQVVLHPGLLDKFAACRVRRLSAAHSHTPW